MHGEGVNRRRGIMRRIRTGSSPAEKDLDNNGIVDPDSSSA